MSTQAGGNGFLHRLEIGVRADLTGVEASPSEEEAVGLPIGEWQFDPEDAQRYEVGLQNLLGAVEVLETVEIPEGGPEGGQ